MKAKLNLSTTEKVVVGGTILSSIVLGVVPTVIIGGIGYYFKDDAENFLVKNWLITRAPKENLFSKISNIWKN